MAKTRICVLFGGMSADHNASLATAYSVLNALSKDDYEVLPVGITRSGRWLFYPGKYENIVDGSWERDSDCCPCVLSPDPLYKGIIMVLSDGETSIHRIDGVFPLLHGKFGEDGRIQGLCKLSGLSLIGNNMSASNNCIDRKATNLLLTDANILTAKYRMLDRSVINNLEEVSKELEEELHYPMYLSPANCSTSVGTYRANDPTELKEAIKSAFSHHPVIIAEECVKGRSIECAIIKELPDDMTQLGELVRCESETDDNSPYIAGTYTLKVPAELDKETEDRIYSTARAAFNALECNRFARVDMTLCENGDIKVRRVRSIPGLAKDNIFPTLITGKRISYEQMLDFMINSAVNAR